MHRGEVYSDKLESQSGRRNYFFNLKVDRNGVPFIAIVESTSRPDGSYRRNQVLVYEEDIPAFQNQMQMLAEQLKKHSTKRATTSGDS